MTMRKPDGGEWTGMTKGVAASLAASALFWYVTLLEPLAGVEVFGWRMLFNAPVITTLLLVTGEWGLVQGLVGRVRWRPALVLGILMTATLIGAQLWVFVWGPVNGHALEVSLGFFLMPLVLVLSGRVVFGERLSGPQLVAALTSAVGVGNELVRVGGLSWVALLVAVGYPAYFTIWRLLRTDHQGSVWVEMHLCCRWR